MEEAPLRWSVGSRNGFVTIEFGRQVAWLAMTREQAEALAAEILKAAATVAHSPAVMGGIGKITIDDTKVFVRKADGTLIAHDGTIVAPETVQ